MADTPSISFTWHALSGRRTFRVQTWTPVDALTSPGAAWESALSAPWPRQVGEVAEARWRVLCIGPIDWIVVTAEETAGQVKDELIAQASRECASIIEVSDALPSTRIEGRGLREILARGCALDLDPAVFTSGQCARTRFANVPAILHCVDEGSTFDCYVTRSVQGYLHAWLADARANV